MLAYLARRVVYAIPIALAVSLVCFMLVHIAPGDPVNAIVPADAPQAVVDQIKHEYGLDRPLPVQFGLWLGHVVQGDLGRSLATGRSVWSDLQPAVINTLRLALAASLLGFVLGVTLGGLAGATRGSWIDRIATSIAVAGVSVPHYWLGMVLVSSSASSSGSFRRWARGRADRANGRGIGSTRNSSCCQPRR